MSEGNGHKPNQPVKLCLACGEQMPFVKATKEGEHVCDPDILQKNKYKQSLLNWLRKNWEGISEKMLEAHKEGKPHAFVSIRVEMNSTDIAPDWSKIFTVTRGE